MKEIININFVSPDAPNILLIADINNNYMQGQHLKHFKNTHNIYALIHNTDNDFAYYYDLPSKHNEIVAELNKHNLHNFIISTHSFGGLLAFYLIFHLPEFVEKAYVFDYFLESHLSLQNDQPHHKIPHIILTNWKIPAISCNKIFFILCYGNYVSCSDIIFLTNHFPNIIILPLPINHNFYKKLNFKQNIIFFFLNGYLWRIFINKIYPLWINNKKLPLSFRIFPRKLALKIFLYFCRKKGYKIKH